MIKNLKKIISLCLAISITSTAFGNVALAASDENTNMDKLDVILASHNVMHSENEAEDLWPETISDLEMVPLYNPAGDIVAYYLSISDQYAVINNNIENPAAIEFGEGDNDIIREILDNNTDPHIVYNNPFEIYDSNDSITARRSYEELPDLYEYYPDLQEENAELADEHLQRKLALEQAIENLPMTYDDDDDYGFLDTVDLPSGSSYTQASIPKSNDTSWMVVYDDYKSATVYDHCGAIAVTNLALYYSLRGYSNLDQGGKDKTFAAVHKIVKNGPKATIATDLKTYFSNCGYTAKTRSASSYNAVKDAVRSGHPSALLLEGSIDKWHWILAVGYREYSSNEKYFRIMDGWKRHTNKFYRPNFGSNWISATEYWVE